MAEFVLGLTKMAVEGTVSRVKLAIEEEEELRARVENDLVFITGEFQMMQSFLKVANVKGDKNEIASTWVRQIRDLAFDAEDCLEFVVHLDKKTVWPILRRFGRMVVFCNYNAPPLPLDKAVADIKRIKARIVDVSQRNTRYNLIVAPGSNSKPVSSTEQPALAATRSSAFRIFSKVWKATRKWRGMADLDKLIKIEGDGLQVISLWGNTGAADLGATSICSEVYNDPEICRLFRTRVWVKLVTPFNPDEFLKSLLTQVCTSSNEANIGRMDFRTKMKAAVDTENDLKKADLMKQILKHRYLLIIEGVFNMVEWDVIKMFLPDSNNGSRIIVSTRQLRVAFSCTEKPYQVSELARFLDDQCFCAFSIKSGRRSGKGELIWQIRCGGVISVRGETGDIKSTVVHKVYTSIMHKSKLLEGVEFKRHSWVNIPIPFDLKVFSRRLLMNFRSEDLQFEEIDAVGKMRDPALTEECCKFLREDNCLVVINGLQSRDDWKMIKDAFFSESIRGCIIVITDEESVATHCVDDEDGALSIEDLEADPMLHYLIKDCQHYGIKGQEASRRSRFLSIRREEAREWFEKFGHLWSNKKLSANRVTSLWGRNKNLLENRVTSLWGTACAWKSDIVRSVYYGQIIDCESSCEQDLPPDQKETKFTMYSWVDVQHPFNLTVFFWRLLLDFYSDDLQAKRTAAVGIMEGQDPIQRCFKFLREYKCLVVIDGLRTKHDWDLIKDAFLSEPAEGCTIVITNNKSVATYIALKKPQALNAKKFKPDMAVHPLEKGCYSRLFSNRSEKARDFTNTFTLIGSQAKSAQGLYQRLSADRRVISVWGIAGVGKSTLVKSVYYHAMLGLWQYFQGGKWFCRSLRFTKYSWVNVPHPFNLTDLSRCLLLDFYSDDMQAKDAAAVGTVDGQDPIQGCHRFLHEHKCFVVIDGLRSTEDWDLIKAAFLQNSTKSCIVVITTEKSVAKHCVQHIRRMVEVKCLEADFALSLFNQIAWCGKDLTPEEMELSEQTVAKCGGILKVIAAMGQVLAKKITEIKDSPWNKPILETFWMNEIKHYFTELLESSHHSDSLFAWMQSYFDACPDRIKPCIFYLSVFPKKHDIRRRRLVWRWIAEGYTGDTSGRYVEDDGGSLFLDTSARVAEENGKRLFSELVDFNIIQPIERKVMCQVNGFFHEYIISRPMEDNHVFALEGHFSLNTQHAGQHLTIRSSWDRDEIVFNGMDFSRLRSLTVFGEWKSFLICKKMKLVRVLDLEDASVMKNDDLENIGKRLPRLKFLSLRGHKEISRLPESLCGLRHLQTLDFRGTAIVTLPPGIVNLKKLRYIRAGTILPWDEGDGTVARVQEAVPDEVRTSTTPWTLVSSCMSNFRKLRHDSGGVTVPRGIANLTALHTLGDVNVNVADGKDILKEIKKLTQLRKLGISGINRGNWQQFCSAISGHAHLESLSMRVDKDKEGLFARFSDICQPPKTLNSLKVYGHVQILPVWLAQLRNLRKGNFGMTVSTQQDIENLYTREILRGRVHVPRVCIKPIEDCVLTVSKPAEATGSSLRMWNIFYSKVLEIDCTCKLEVTFGERKVYPPVYPIEVLKVNCSSSGSSLRISGLENLEKLKEVQLKGFYGDGLKQDLQRQIDEHPEKPALKLE